MTLEDALSCGLIPKVVVKQGYTATESAPNGSDVRYGLRLEFNNTTAGKESDIGVILTNLQRGASWTLETASAVDASVGIAMKFTSTADASQNYTGFEIISRHSNTGYSAVFDEKASIENGRLVEYVAETEKVNVSPLGVDEAKALLLAINPKKFADSTRPTEEVVGVTHDGINPLLSTSVGDGVAPNALLAIAITAMHQMYALIAELYAKKVVEREYIREGTIPYINKYPIANEQADTIDSNSYFIVRNKPSVEDSNISDSQVVIITQPQTVSEDSNISDNQVVIINSTNRL